MPTVVPAPLELALPGGMVANDVFAALRAVMGVAADAASTAEWTYLDTFDGRLRRTGFALEHARRTGTLRLVTVDTRTVEATAVLPAARRSGAFVADLPEGPVRSAIAGVVEMRVLLPKARVTAAREDARLLDPEGKTVGRVRLERPALLQSGHEPAPLIARLSLVPVLGYDRAFQRVADLLERMHGLRPPDRPLYDEAVVAAGGVPGGVSAKVSVGLAPDMRADVATVALCRRLAEIVESNLPGTLADVDTEFLHDLRVAVRRTRSVLREMKGVLPAEAAERARADLRWVQEVTGPTRDLDVHLLGWADTVASLPPRAATDIAPLLDMLAGRRKEAFGGMRRQLRSRRFAAAWAGWTQLLTDADVAVVRAPDDGRPNAARPVAEVAGRRIAAVHRAMVRMGSAIDDGSPPEALHDLRKRGKELRYLLELYGQLWPQEVITAMISTMKSLQDVLGRFQDDEVQAEYLRSLAPDLATTDRGTDAVIALGQLIGGLLGDQREARTSFARQFAPFASRHTRALVRATFGSAP